MSSAVIGNGDSAASNRGYSTRSVNSVANKNTDTASKGAAAAAASASREVNPIHKKKGDGLKSSPAEVVSTVPSTGQDLDDNDDDDDDPFELKDWAERWLEENMPAATKKNVNPQDCYTPYDASRNKGVIPEAHWSRVYEEFWRCFMDDTSSSSRTGPSVLLVATGVDKDWTPGEELKKAKFLFFQAVEYHGTKTSALFITYMPGKEHGAADASVNNFIGNWLVENELDVVLNGGLSSGNYAKPQPDRRLFPDSPYRDSGDEDIDPNNGNEAYSRLIWEVEYKNRNPMDMRRNGKRLMKSRYNRLYLAAKIYGPDPEDGLTEAAIVLWGRNGENNDNIEVIEAVSFGTKDLSDEHKNEFAGNASRSAVIGVGISEWRRPAEFPLQYPFAQKFRQNTPTPDDLLLDIPIEGLLYKILIPTGTEGTPMYLNDLQGDRTYAVSNLKIDLGKLLRSVLILVGTEPGAPAPAPAQSRKKTKTGK